MIKAVIFDFDGTLIDNMHLHYKSLVKALEGRLKIEKKALYMKEGGNVRSIISELTKELALDDYELDRVTVLKHSIYEELSKNIRLRPEALELIKKLRKLNFKIGLATGSPRHVLDDHTTSRELALFDCIVTGDETKKPKPHPEPYLKCADGLSVRPEEAVVIENAPLGVESAKSAGMICIALTSTVAKEDLRRADFVVGSLSEVEDIIKRL